MSTLILELEIPEAAKPIFNALVVRSERLIGMARLVDGYVSQFYPLKCNTWVFQLPGQRWIECTILPNGRRIGRQEVAVKEVWALNHHTLALPIQPSRFRASA